MRQKVTVDRLKQFMRGLAQAAQSPGNVYFTGGATALLLGLREQTLDIDLKLDPEPRGAFQAIATLKNELNLNVELAAPDDFIPRTHDWRERSQYIESIGALQFFHYDFGLQALAKLERGHAQDLEDVTNLLRGRYTSPEMLRSLYGKIEPDLIRYPAVDPVEFQRKLEHFLGTFQDNV